MVKLRFVDPLRSGGMLDSTDISGESDDGVIGGNRDDGGREKEEEDEVGVGQGNGGTGYVSGHKGGSKDTRITKGGK